jgi:hypothetical protein
LKSWPGNWIPLFRTSVTILSPRYHFNLRHDRFLSHPFWLPIHPTSLRLMSHSRVSSTRHEKKKLHDLSPQANYTSDRRLSAKLVPTFLGIEVTTWSAWRIPTEQKQTWKEKLCHWSSLVLALVESELLASRPAALPQVLTGVGPRPYRHSNSDPSVVEPVAVMLSRCSVMKLAELGFGISNATLSHISSTQWVTFHFWTGISWHLKTATWISASAIMSQNVQLGYLDVTVQENLRSGWPGPFEKVEGCCD